MLNIKDVRINSDMTIELEGRLDTVTAPELEKTINEKIDGVSELTFDIKSLEYISSAGLRVLLLAQKNMNKKGHMIIKSPSRDVMEIFDVTGFSDIFTIQ